MINVRIPYYADILVGKKLSFRACLYNKFSVLIDNTSYSIVKVYIFLDYHMHRIYRKLV